MLASNMTGCDYMFVLYSKRRAATSVSALRFRGANLSKLGMEAACQTDAGRVRQQNEDRYKVDPKSGVLVIADGMGGHAGGEVASQIAVDTITDILNSADTIDAKLLEKALRKANDAILKAATDDAELHGMGTTAVIAALVGKQLIHAHVGDSRLYRIRKGTLEQLTDDHSLLAERVAEGELTQEEADALPLGNVITRALGVDPGVQVDTGGLDCEPGDMLLLCTDGLTDMVGDDDILQRITSADGDLESACQALIDQANDNGGHDNITVILARTT